MIEAPVEDVWELVGNPARHTDWWPRFVEVRGERFDQGEDYAAVSRQPLLGAQETTLVIDRRDELRELQIHCARTGSYWNWALTGAAGSTFVDVEFGIRPLTRWDRIFDRTFARAFFRSWMADSVKALAAAARGTPRKPASG